MGSDPRRLLDRLVGFCVTILIGALALYGAIWLLRAIWPDLLIVALVSAAICGLIAWLRYYESRW